MYSNILFLYYLCSDFTLLDEFTKNTAAKQVLVDANIASLKQAIESIETSMSKFMTSMEQL